MIIVKSRTTGRKDSNNLEKAQSELDRNIERSEEQETTDHNPISDIHGVPISNEWAAEFRGFIWGEGMFYIQKSKKGFPAYLRVTLRSDDKAILEEFQNRLGGTLVPRKSGNKNSNPCHLWQVADTNACLRIAGLLNTNLPFNKAKQFPVWKAALEIKKQKGLRHYTKEERRFMEWAASELQRLKQWID